MAVIIYGLFMTVNFVLISSHCEEGYFSHESGQCMKCPTNCRNCDSLQYCMSCAEGYWGTTCEHPCSRCQPGTSCEKTNGFCLESCKDGSTGILCDAVCNKNCLSCDRINAGLCLKCPSGFYGEKCDKPCPNLCHNLMCNNTGQCAQGCKNGYWGLKCDQKCSKNCKNISCRYENGTCLYGCENDVSGTKCEEKFDEMHISRTNNEENGIESEGYNKDRKPTKDNDGGNRGSEDTDEQSIIIIPILIGFVVLGVVLIAVYVVRRKMLTQNKEQREKRGGTLMTDVVLDNWKYRHVFNLDGRKSYIVCKDPDNMEDVSAFWDTVWKEMCSVIVKLSRMDEESVENRYWPERFDSKTYGNIAVTNADYKLSVDYTQRRLDTEMDMESRPVTQLQFADWPPNMLPSDEMKLLKFRQMVEEVRNEETGPLLVHCSDGISRSGPYIAMDIVMKKLERQDVSDAQVDQYLDRFRAVGLISSDEQYEFLRRTIGKRQQLYDILVS